MIRVLFSTLCALQIHVLLTYLLTYLINVAADRRRSCLPQELLWQTRSFVVNNFVKNLLTAKSSACKFDIFCGHTSTPYNSTGKHLLLITCKVTINSETVPLNSTLSWQKLFRAEQQVGVSYIKNILSVFTSINGWESETPRRLRIKTLLEPWCSG